MSGRRGAAFVLALSLPWVLTACTTSTVQTVTSAEVPTIVVLRGPFTHDVTADGNLEATDSTTLTVPISTRGTYTISWVAEDASPVEEGDVVVRFERAELERELDDGRADLAAADSKLEKDGITTKAELTNLGRDVASARLALDATREFQPKDEQIYSRQQIIEGAIDADLAEARTGHASDRRQHRTAETAKGRELLSLEKEKAKLTIERAEDGLAGTEVRAPHAGILLLRRNWRGEAIQAGQSVWQGNELGRIPNLDEMRAEVHVLEADAGGLEVGLPAVVIVAAHPEREFAATIQRVDNLAKPRVRGVPVQYFGVTLELSQTDRSFMKPGQRVRARLRLADAQDVIVIPRQCVSERDGESVAWVHDGSQFVARTIVLGAGSPGRVVVESGLSEGDVVALRHPEALD